MNENLKIPEDILKITQTLQAKGHETYVVGGAVRDALLNRETKDWDVCTQALPEAVTQIFAKVIPTGLKHGTVTVMSQTQRPVEVTTFRTEGKYADGRRPEEVFYTKDIQADLARRDFTINAMAYDPVTKTLHDPFGGQTDLQQKIIRTVGNAKARFEEDGLRPMRAVRFAAQLGFALTQETFDAIGETLAVFQKVATERVRDELIKILESPKPSHGLELMRTTGLLALVLPELLEGYKITQNDFHAYDVYTHSLKACDEAPLPWRLRLSALLHDVGKPRTRQFLKDAYRFYGHDRVGAKMTGQILSRLRFSNDDKDYAVNLVNHHMFYYQDHWSDSAVRRLLKRVGPENIEDLMKLRIADEKASGVNPPDYQRLENMKNHIAKLQTQTLALDVKHLAIDGHALMQKLNIKPGPIMGKILHQLLEQVLDDPTLNTPERLLELASRWLSSQDD